MTKIHGPVEQAPISVQPRDRVTTHRGEEPGINEVQFAGLQRVASAAESAFVQGILLYDGEQTLSFAEKLLAAPLPLLWA